jgi:hypothetical protein
MFASQRHRRRIGDLPGVTFHDEVELIGGDTERAARVGRRKAVRESAVDRLLAVPDATSQSTTTSATSS